ncbi:MAG: uracil-DNA glycosylase [Anaerolineales bacterium]|nr:uracil-DNA glycosylase [Anaerolineales bacterium]
MIENPGERLRSLALRMERQLETPLAEQRRQNEKHLVFGAGDPAAEVVFVGEAPGRREAESGEPFVGAAGKLLEALLSEIGLERGAVYITNVVKDRPPGNRRPRVGEIESYKPYLIRQLDIIQPEIIVPLGLVASKVVLEMFAAGPGSHTMGALHGHIFECDAAWGEIRILPMYHPAASFYGSLSKADLQEDFKVLQDILGGV